MKANLVCVALLAETMPRTSAAGTAHQVDIRKGFWIGQTEVTQEAYRRMTGTNPSRYGGERLPVDQISWYDASDYCTAASSRYGPLYDVVWHDGNSADSSPSRQQVTEFLRALRHFGKCLGVGGRLLLA
jgi:formylglycine-generating enzyme required for sulfatase activity